MLNSYAFTPGDVWKIQSFVRAGKALGSVVAGEVFIDEQRYNYFQHTYEDFQLFSATAVGNANQRVLAKILWDTPSVPTARNIVVGNSVVSQNALLKSESNTLGI
ncbi:hypothetical protein [Pantoea stewartii]|uniref:hypothetical protein n=1 Tax=Pantoea stewartii TaxID=66269 RepID=UPI00345C18FF